MAIKLLYITNGITGSGGLERVLSIKASSLADTKDYEVFILSLNELGIESFYKFSPKIKRISIEYNGIKSYVRGIYKSVKEISPDIISVCDDGLKGFFLPRLLNKKYPIIYERHVSKDIELQQSSNLIEEVTTKCKLLIMNSLAKSFSRFVVLTEGNLQEWNHLKNIEVIPNPLSFYPEDIPTNRNNIVISVGKLSFQKGQDLLLHAWKIVHDKYPNWKLELYGAKNKSLKLEELACNLKIENSVTFYNPEKDIQKRYIDAAIYVMSSRFEGFGMVLIEAMACGLPCVSFDCNYGPSDVIRDREDGLLVKTGNVEMLAERILTLIEDPNLREQYTINARENVKRFQANHIVEVWDNLFKQLLSKQK